MNVKFRNVGNSISVTIPREIVKKYNIINGTEANISDSNGVIMVEPIKKRVTIKSLFSDYKGDYKPKEFDWGEKKGAEIW